MLGLDPDYYALVGGCTGAVVLGAWRCGVALLRGFQAPRREHDFWTNLQDTLQRSSRDTCVGTAVGFGVGVAAGALWPMSGALFGLVLLSCLVKHTFQDARG